MALKMKRMVIFNYIILFYSVNEILQIILKKFYGL